MMGRIVYEIAQLVSDAAHERISQCVENEEDAQLHLRGSLLLAVVANEVEAGTSKEELVRYLERIYDVVNNPPTIPPPACRRN